MEYANTNRKVNFSMFALFIQLLSFHSKQTNKGNVDEVKLEYSNLNGTKTHKGSNI